MKKHTLFIAVSLLGCVSVLSAVKTPLLTKAGSSPLPYVVESDLYEAELMGTGAKVGDDANRPNAVHFTDASTYINIKPKSGKTLASENGITVSFWTRHTDTTSVSEYERVIKFYDSTTKQANWCSGGINYMKAYATTSASYVNGYNVFAMVTTHWKYVTVSFDFNAKDIHVYHNGTLTQAYVSTSSKYADCVTPFIDIAKKGAYTEGLPLRFRSDDLNSVSGKNSTRFMADAIEVDDKPYTAKMASDKFETVLERPNDVKVNGKVKGTDYELVYHGNVARDYDSTHPNSFWMSGYDQYIEFKPKTDGFYSGKGLSLSFWERCVRKSTSSSDVNSYFATKVSADFVDNTIVNNDAWVDILGFTSNDGHDAGICSSAVWYEKRAKDATRYADASNRKLLMSSIWQYVTIVVDFDSWTIRYFVNGLEAAHAPSGYVLNGVLTYLKESLERNDSLNFRKPISIRTYRNHSGLMFDDLEIDVSPLSDALVQSRYLEKVSSAYLKTYIDGNLYIIKDSVGTADLSSFSAPGLIIKQWYEDEGKTQKIDTATYTVTEAKTIYCDYEYVGYAINYYLNGGANNPDNPSSFTIVDEFELQPATKKGYEFIGWYVDENYLNPQTKILKGTAEDLTLYAKWKAVEYVITYELNGGVFLMEAPESYTVEDGDITLPSLFKGGYTFLGWTIDGEETNVIKTSLAKNVTVVARFELAPEPVPPTPEKKNYTGLVIGCSIGGAVLIGGIVALIIVLKKKGAK